MTKTILVVDDNENIWLRCLKIDIEAAGWRFFGTQSLDEAKQLAADNHIDLTLIDGMNGDGAKLAEWLKERKLGGILVAHSSHKHHNSSMQEAGCDCAIDKAVLVRARIKRMRQLLSN